MANNITTSKGAVMQTINGVTYFKLQSKYPGDYTKHCGLLANEIDENFYFLRGYDIKDAEYVDNDLVLTRVNGDKLVAEMPKAHFELDKKSGKIIITFPDGTEEILDGFVLEGCDVRVATDYTLRGDGRICNPLRLSEVEKTGTYAPAKYFLDLTISANTMPDGDNLGKGFRIVTKETIEPFGLLYNFEGVTAIQSALTAMNSPWRVPTRKDWGEMLNSAEYCDECRNHTSDSINEWKGCVAGIRAKSTTSWEDFDGDDDGNPTKGLDNLPMTGSDGTFHVIPVGYAEGSRGAITSDFNYDIEGLKKVASFWSNTATGSKFKSAQPNIYTRTFSFDSTHVLEESSKPSSRLSLRLVRDFNLECTDFNEYTNILGYNVPCVLISNPDTNYSQIWTSVNIGFTNPEFDGKRGKQWNKLVDEDREKQDLYFINEWNGAEWVKKQMRPGDSVVILDYDNDPATSGDTYHEWRVFEVEDGVYELIDTVDALKKEFSKEFDEINERIDDLESALSAETAERIAEDEKINERIDNEIERAISAETALDNKIDAETERAISAETMLDNKIDAETERAITEETAIWSALTQEIADRVAADEKINNRLDEIESAITGEIERLDEKIDAETERATDREDEIEGLTIDNGNFTVDTNNSIDMLVLTRHNGEKIEIMFNGNFGTLPTE